MNVLGQKIISDSGKQIIKQNLTANDLQNYLDRESKESEFTVISDNNGTYTLIVENQPLGIMS